MHQPFCALLQQHLLPLCRRSFRYKPLTEADADTDGPSSSASATDLHQQSSAQRERVSLSGGGLAAELDIAEAEAAEQQATAVAARASAEAHKESLIAAAQASNCSPAVNTLNTISDPSSAIPISTGAYLHYMQKQLTHAQDRCLPLLLRHSCPMQCFLLWFTAQYLFNKSLSLTSVTSNTILSSSSSLFTFALSMLVLKEPYSLAKLLSIAACIGGEAAVVLLDRWGQTTHITWA